MSQIFQWETISQEKFQQYFKHSKMIEYVALNKQTRNDVQETAKEQEKWHSKFVYLLEVVGGKILSVQQHSFVYDHTSR